MSKLATTAIALALVSTCSAQFSGGFSPSNAPDGGFGGGDCTASKTPVVFLHGNGDNASGWTHPSSVDGKSPLDHFTAAGYNDCELFGLTWLSSSEQAAVANNYHQESKAQMVTDFISDVQSYTGQSKVAIIGHSMGVTVGLHSMEYNNNWNSVSDFVGISGAMLGLAYYCNQFGYANPAAATCGSQNVYDYNIFGFWPGDEGVTNTHMSSSGFITYPKSQSGINFYSIRAGTSDEIVCPDATDCTSSLFQTNGNVPSQLMVGEGKPAVSSSGTDDTTGVGHFRSRSNTGAIQVNMLAGCSGTACCSSYNGNVCTT